MGRRSKYVLSTLFVFAVVALVFVVPPVAPSDELEITGVVFVSDSLDLQGMDSVVLASEDGEMYSISMDERGAELVQHENRFVKITGMLVIDKNGRKTITVKDYQVVQH